ncbi:uncharacterized protein LOC123540457 [Mercenaria mercenaria]|uniref:uncharacterized protein LOC123540457 n=1 Tax=Mercenaria mercenaria TaxID=6596 RepID=UPI00234F7459|nr:uncharacterized protein LOC123540457 [Mercenaria mercenaria]
MKRYCETTGCFLVPVGSKSGQNQETEWRISTSLADRCLMFDLNITQIRCYVLMKMILKTFINPQCDGVLSSFMCKTVLLYCVENTQSNVWVEHNLLACLNHCLLELHTCITQENCPHFITPENNLLAGKLSPQIRCRLLEILQKIIQSEGAALLEISIDDLGMRLEEKMNTILARPVYQHYKSPAAVHAQISAKLLKHVARQLAIRHDFYLSKVMYNEKQIVHSRLLVCTLAKRYAGNSLSSLEKATYKVVIPLLCSSLASAIASRDIGTNKTISQEAEDWFSAGLNSDVSSGRLKFASALYCAGDFERAELILRNTEDIYDQDSVETVCTCRDGRVVVYRMEFFNRSNTGNEELVKQITAFCVRFIPCEKNCVPKEMQYEMFRSTKEEMLKRDKHRDSWMDWSVVDSLPYLYFLQYKTYGQLRRTAGKYMALANLIVCTLRGLNIMHTETALNLLGQCLEQENRFAGAFKCYVRSLNICEKNNVAKIHICRLLNVLVNRKAV